MPLIVLLVFAIITFASIFVSTALFWVLFTLFLIYLALAVKILPEYRRGVLFTLGRYDGVVGPGLIVIIPLVQSMRIVDLRVHTLDIPPQEVITKDNVSVRVNGVVFYRVLDPAKAVINVNDYAYATSAIAQTTLRDVVGGVELDQLLENRDSIAQEIRKIVDEKTDQWGIDITEIRLQDITLPDDLKRAIAIQAEAEREKRAVIIKAEGDLAAAQNYAKAAEILAKTPGALTLRTLQTLSDLSKDPSQKFYFVVPLEILESWIDARKQAKK
ncbi:MAG: slipin family protein [Candidatus Diapherotrites archaeon]|nr:slipin family protein [Candidatus Diapherotrites archaeon]